MYKRIDFSNLGGYPLTQQDHEWLQSSYRSAFSMIANLAGDQVILTGMEEAGGEVTAGWISINGELVPFAAGAIGTGEFRLQETAVSRTFNDGVAKDVRFEKVAIFSAGGPYNYADLVRIGNLVNFWTAGDVKEKVCDMDYLAANFDVDGYGLNREKGWRILSKAYPDTAGKMMVNYNSDDPDYNELGNTGGSKTVVLTADQLPALASANYKLVNLNGLNTFTSGDPSGGEYDLKNAVSWPGTGQPINKMNPYYVILKLVKL